MQASVPATLLTPGDRPYYDVVHEARSQRDFCHKCKRDSWRCRHKREAATTAAQQVCVRALVYAAGVSEVLCRRLEVFGWRRPTQGWMDDGVGVVGGSVGPGGAVAPAAAGLTDLRLAQTRLTDRSTASRHAQETMNETEPSNWRGSWRSLEGDWLYCGRLIAHCLYFYRCNTTS